MEIATPRARDESARRVDGSSEHGWLGERIASAVAPYSLFALALILLMTAVGAYIAGHFKALWYDEIFSVIVAQQGSWQRMLKAMPADGNPPLLAFLIKICIHLFGRSDFSIRLPSLVAFLGALIGVYIFIKRECGPVLGLFAAMVMLAQPGWSYSFEARPYALLLGFMMLGIVSWQSAAQATESAVQHSRQLAYIGIFVAVVGCILSHHIGVVEVGIPLLLAETMRIWRRKCLDWPVILSGLLALPTLLWTVPMARQTSELILNSQHNNAWPPTLHNFVHYWVGNAWLSFPLLVSSGLVGILAIAVLLSWKVGTDQAPAELFAFTPGAPAAALGAALLIPVTWLLMMTGSGYYNCRYGIGSIAGIGLVAALALRRFSRQPRSIAIGFLAALVPLFLWPILFVVRHPPGGNPHTDAIYTDTSALPIVVADPFRYVPLWWYAPPTIRNRLYYLTDPQYAVDNGFIVVETALAAEQPVIDAHIADFGSFLETHPNFFIDQTGTIQPESMKDRVEAAGFSATPAPPSFGPEVYTVSRSSLPPRN